MRHHAYLPAITVLALGGAAAADPRFDFGTEPTEEEIERVDIDVMPDGGGLPPGQGTVAEGRRVYEAQCAACHGENLEGVSEAGGAALIGGRGTIGTPETTKTIESYWPYASTVYDYVNRAMPLHAPGSLSVDQVYAVTAYILFRSDIIEEDMVLTAENLPEVEMPNEDGFIPDPRLGTRY